MEKYENYVELLLAIALGVVISIMITTIKSTREDVYLFNNEMIENNKLIVPTEYNNKTQAMKYMEINLNRYGSLKNNLQDKEYIVIKDGETICVR